MVFIPEYKRQVLLFVAIIAAILFLSVISFAVESLLPQKTGIPVVFSADMVTTNFKKKEILLEGKAVITQAGREIRADRIMINFSGSKNHDGEKSQQIDKLTAEGNVVINMDARQAKTDNAVYTAVDRRIVLTGRNSEVTGPEGHLSCSRIVIDQASSVAECIGTDKNRASGLIFSDKNGF